VILQPRTVTLTVNSVPSGMTVALGTGAAQTPFTRTVIMGTTTTVTAQSPQESGGQMYGFTSWSDGGAATHQVNAAGPLTLTATYQLAASLSISETATALMLKGGRAVVNATIANAGRSRPRGSS
jgi:hypothetical protein